MIIATAQAIQESLCDRLTQWGFHVEQSSRGIWAAHHSGRKRGLLGWREVDYCLTCVLDQRLRMVRVWDAVLDHHTGLLPPRSAPTELAGVSGVRTGLEALVHDAGWALSYGFREGAAPAPRVFAAGQP
jgi:hypothetical protein